jgi:hypothetical protein
MGGFWDWACNCIFLITMITTIIIYDHHIINMAIVAQWTSCTCCNEHDMTYMALHIIVHNEWNICNLVQLLCN